ARLTWVGGEPVPPLIAAHGEDRVSVPRPAGRGEAGCPALLPIAHLDAFRALASDRMPDELLDDLGASGVPFRILETGDPGVARDASTPRPKLPPYEGPPEPADPHAHEWGAAEAVIADD